MKKTVSRVPMGEGQTQVVVRFEDIETAEGTIEAQHRQVTFLRELLDTPALMLCDVVPFQHLRMGHDGHRWIIQLDALVTKDS